MAKATIRGIELPILKVFSSDYCFVIPNYQRPYSWNKEKAGQLLDDLKYFAFQKDNVDECKPYFLGSVVLIKDDESPLSKVVDGQQRLTTITILLSVLRELTTAVEKKSHITRIIYEAANQFTGTKDRCRLKLRDRDQTFFMEYIQRDGGLSKMPSEASLSDSQTNIRANALDLKGRLEKEFNEEQRDQLTKYLMQKCFLVVVSSSDDESAYRIFSVLNDRGMPLLLTDILKAEVIGAVPASEQDAYAKKWEDIEENLGRDSFEELFTHIRMIVVKAKAQESVLQEFRKHIEPTKNAKSFIDDQLSLYSAVFQDIRKEDFESVSQANDKEINQYFRWLNLFDNKDWVPPAMLYLSKWGYKETAKVIEFLKKLERLAFGLYVMREGINSRIKRYGIILASIEGMKDISDMDFGISLTSEECQKIVEKLSSDVYGEPYAEYILLRLDSYMSGGAASYNYPIISIEHVLPQTPKAGSKWMSDFSEQDRKELTHCLGNLVLLSRRKNSAAQNYDFEKKKTNYFVKDGVSPFPLTTDVLIHSEWIPSVIRTRKNKLLQDSKTIWSL